MMIEPLKWDSKFFNLKIGKITDDNQQVLPSSSDIKRYDLIYVEKLDKKNLDKKFIRLLNINFTDEKKIYLKTLEDKNPADKNINEYILKTANKKITELAIQSGAYSRFKLDLNFAKDHYKKLYVKWIKNSVEKKSANVVFVYGDVKNPLGFITLVFKEEMVQVGLIAVGYEDQKKGIGKALLSAAENFALKNNFTKLQVVTQSENKNACRFYEKCGFEKKAVIYTHHHWDK